MENIDTKEKMISLFKSVMGDKDFKFTYSNPNNSFRDSNSYINNCSVYSEEYVSFHTQEQEYQYCDMDGETINPYDFRKMYNEEFPVGKTLNTTYKSVTISFSELPNLTISQTLIPSISEVKSIDITGKSWYTTNKKIYERKYRLIDDGKTTINFGGINHIISGEEFEELYTMASNELDIRDKKFFQEKLNSDKEKLEARINKYKK